MREIPLSLCSSGLKEIKRLICILCQNGIFRYFRLSFGLIKQMNCRRNTTPREIADQSYLPPNGQTTNLL